MVKMRGQWSSNILTWSMVQRLSSPQWGQLCLMVAYIGFICSQIISIRSHLRESQVHIELKTLKWPLGSLFKSNIESLNLRLLKSIAKPWLYRGHFPKMFQGTPPLNLISQILVTRVKSLVWWLLFKLIFGIMTFVQVRV